MTITNARPEWLASQARVEQRAAALLHQHEPLFYATLRDHTAALAREQVRAGLAYCPTCGATGDQPCRTRGGLRAGAWHTARLRGGRS